MKRYLLIIALLIGLGELKTYAQTNFGYIGAAGQSYTVPAGVTKVRIQVWGASGGASGVNGAYVTAERTVTPGQVMTIYVGGAGGTGGYASGGWPGGGSAGGNYGNEGGGGGYTTVDYWILAGGGGGKGGYVGPAGGASGCNGSAGGDGQSGGGGGGTQSGGGAGGYPNGGSWGSAGGQYSGGTGGSGNIGGGGGGADNDYCCADAGAGGGGSSINPGGTNSSCSSGGSPGGSNGYVTITSLVTAPVLTTSAISAIETGTATCGGSISDNGGNTVTESGICWSTSPTPTIGNTHTHENSTSSFTSYLTGLSSNTTYYVRAYATSTSGTGYGNEVSFKTKPGDPGTASTGAPAICRGTSTTLSVATPVGTVYWYSGSCGGASAGSTGSNSLSVSPTETTTYYAKNYNGLYSTNCSSAITVTVKQLPAQPATATVTVPSGVSGQTTANLSWAVSASGQTPITYKWAVGTSAGITYEAAADPFRGTTSDPAVLTATATGLTKSTTYYLAVKAVNECSVSAYRVSAAFKTNHLLTYTAGSYGSISGTASQTVVDGENGTTITAVPDANYNFVSWSDGSTNPVRREMTVHSSISVTATFAANRLAFDLQPVNKTTDEANPIPVRVKVTDTYGATMTNSTALITISIQNNPSAGTLGGDVHVAAVDGIATFTDLWIDKTGNGYTLRASAASPIITVPVSTTFNITAGAIDHFTVTNLVSPVIAGTVTTPIVTAYDHNNNIKTDYTGTIVFSSTDPIAVLPTAGLGFNLNFTGSNGVKTFTNGLTLKTTLDRTVTVTGSGKTGVTDPAIHVDPAAISHFHLVANNNSPVMAGLSFNASITVHDQFHNVKTDYVGENLLWTTTATSSPNRTPYHLPANGAQAFTDGMATATGFILYNSAETPDITVSDGPSSSAGTHADIHVVNNVINNFLVESGSGETFEASTRQTAGIPFTIRVTARDVYWNTHITYTGRVRFASSNDTEVHYPPDYTFQSGNAGIKEFTGGLTIHHTGAYWIRVGEAADWTIGGQQEGIVVNPDVFDPDQSTFVLIPSSPLTRVAGEYAVVEFTPRDANGNLLCVATGTKAVKLNGFESDIAGPIAETPMLDDESVPKATGTFRSRVRITTPGTNTLTAWYGGTKNTTQIVLNASPGPVDLAHSTITTNAVEGSITTDQTCTVTVQLKDEFDNNRQSDDGTVTLTTLPIGLGTLTDGSTTSKTLTAVYNGTTTGSYRASFKTIETGLGQATISGKLAGVSIDNHAHVTITYGAAHHLNLTAGGQPSATAVAGVVITAQPVVEIQDWLNNIVAGDNTTIVNVEKLAEGSPSLLSTGDKHAHAANGIATFGGLYYTKAETINLLFTSGSLGAATSADIVVGHNAATQLAIITGPASPSYHVAAGNIFDAQPLIHILDTYGNLVLADGTSTVTAVITSGPGTLAGTTSLIASGGAASFTNLKTITSGVIRLTFSSGSLTSAVSNEITVGPASPTNHFTLTSPADITAGQRAQYTVTRRDIYENETTAGSQTINLSSDAPVTYKLFYDAANGGNVIDHLDLAEGVSSGTFWYYEATSGSWTVTASATGIIKADDPITVIPAATDHFHLSNPADINAGGARAAYTVTRHDVFNNLRTAGAQSVYLYSSSAGANKHFYNDAFAGSTITGITIADGASSSGFWYYDELAGGFTITASETTPAANGATGIIDATDALTVNPNVTNHFHLTSPADITAGNRAAYTVTRHDVYENLRTSGAETVYLYSSSTGANKHFYNHASDAAPGNIITSISIADAASSANFWYYDELAGNFTVTASETTPTANGATEIIDATDAVTVFPAPTSHFHLSRPDIPAEMTAGGTRIAYTVTREDKFHNGVIAGDQPVYLSSNSTGSSKIFYNHATQSAPGNVITNLTVSNGNSSAGFWYYDQKSSFFGVSGNEIDGQWTITVSDVFGDPDGTAGIDDATNLLTVSPTTLRETTSFVVTGLEGPRAHYYGDNETVTVKPVDTWGNVKTNYVGEINFTNSDVNGIKPANHTFIESDHGSYTFSAVLFSGISDPEIGWWIIALNSNSTRTGGQKCIVSARQVLVTAVSSTKTYDGGISSAGSPSVVGLASKDAVNAAPVQVYDNKNCGSNHVLTASGLNIQDGTTHADMAANYVITYYLSAASGVIARKEIDVTAASDTKTYDGGQSSDGVPVVATENLASGDVVNASPTQTYDTKMAGTGKVMTAAGLTIKDGSNANMTANYDIHYLTDATGVISQLHVDVTAATDTKTYDASAASDGVPTIGSLAVGDVVNASPTQTYDTKMVGIGKVMTASGLTIKDGSNANMTANYDIHYLADATGVISQLHVDVTAATDTKTYDANATSDGVPTVGVLASGDVVNASPTQTYDTKMAGTGKVMTSAGLTIKDGSNANMTANYDIHYVTNGTGVINQLDITGNFTVTSTRVYNGGTSANVLTRTLNGVINPDDVTLTGGTASYDTKNRGTGKTVTLTGMSLAGSDAINYNLTGVATTEAAITVRTLTLTYFGADSKVYDGTTVATGIGFQNDRVTGDILSFGRDAAFNNPSIGLGKPVYYTNIRISGGTDMNNYVLSATTGTAYADITPGPLTVTAISRNKSYGTALTGGSGSVAFTATGLRNGETIGSVTLAYGSGASTSDAVGTYVNQVTPSAATGGTFSSGNYTISYVPGDITVEAAIVTITANTGQSKVYGQVDPVFTYSGSPALVTGNSFTGALSRVAGETAGTYSYTIGTLTAGSNYSLTVAATPLFGIITKAITITPTAGQSKSIGSSDPVFAYAFAPALETGDGFTGALSRISGETPGEYSYTLGTLSAGSNYSLSITASPSTFAIIRSIQTIQMVTGWNIISSAIMPVNRDLKNVFQPVINASKLKKVMDEAGRAIEDWGTGFGWNNGIGDILSTEGYRVNVLSAYDLTLEGNLVATPLTIPLTAGWNIISYPASGNQNGKEVVQALIDAGLLVKVMDERGYAIEDWGVGFGWQNAIGDFRPGKGYLVKVNGSASVTINESEGKAATWVTELLASGHFMPAFTGNGIDHMNINLMELKDSGILLGNEIGVFDGSVCVGAVTIGANQLMSGTLSIPVSANDGLSEKANGFTDGNLISLKLFRNGTESKLYTEVLNNGVTRFKKGESLFVRIDANFDPAKLLNVRFYPNPFSDGTSIEIKSSGTEKIDLRIYDVLGRQVRFLFNGTIEGKKVIRWNGTNDDGDPLKSGIYFMRCNGLTFNGIIKI